MAEVDEQVLIEVSFDAKDVAAKAAETRRSLEGLRLANKALAADISAATDTSADSARQLAENNRTILEYNATLKAFDAQLQASTILNEDYGDSLIEMQTQATNLEKVYRSLSKAQRESAQGVELQNRLKELREEINETQKSYGNFSSNVAQYPESVNAAIPGFNKLNSTLKSLDTNIATLATKGAAGFAAIGKSAVAMGRVFLTPPVIVITAILSAILLVVNKVREAFNKSNEATTRVQATFGLLRPVLHTLNEVFNALAVALSYVVEWIGKAIAALIRFNPLVIAFNKIFPSVTKNIIDQAKAGRDLALAISELEQKERDYTEASAKRELQIAKFRAEAADSENKSAKDRLISLNFAIAAEEVDLQKRKKIAKEKLRILEEEAEVNEDTSKATLDAISQARAAVYRAETEFYTGTLRLQAQRRTLLKEIADDEANALKERENAYKEALARRQKIQDTELSAIEKFEDELTKAIADGIERQIRQTEIGANRQIDALRKRLTTEKDLTETARAAINATIVQLELNLQSDIKKIRDEAEKNASDRAIAAEVERLSILLDAARKGSENEYNLRVQQIELLRKQQLSAANLTQQEILNINSKYDAQILELDKQQQKKRAAQERQALLNDVEERRQTLLGKERELAALELEFAIQDQQALINLDEQTKLTLYENQEQYEAAVLESNNRVRQATIATLNTQQNLAENQAKIFGGVVSAIDTMFGEIAGDNAKYAAFLKTLALAQASVELGLSIAAATRTASTGGDPYTVALRIVSATAGVVGSFVSVVKSIKDARIPKAPSFERGGIVPGTSYSGDNITARVNSGEMILNAKQQAQLFDIANRRISTSGIDYQMLANITAKAVASLPPPVLDYDEFTIFRDNVTKYNEYADV